jgi:hypothetical protein
MEFAPQHEEYKLEILSDDEAREIAISALISALKDYSSGPDFPNIPFGD